jgi:nicotinamidase-related amidase
MQVTPQTKYSLFIIDPQNDFCDPTGTLFVPGAQEDCKRISDFISQKANKIIGIQTTLDTHHQHDIAHPILWVDSTGQHPAPFTIITPEDVKAGKWMPIHGVNSELRQHMIEYTSKLKANGRYPLCIWPPHCLIGSWGGNVQQDVFQAYLSWEISSNQPVNYVRKGSNISTEHYSAIKADVPDPRDPSTQPNINLIGLLDKVSSRPDTILLVGGQALSHCVANTMRDLVSLMDITGKQIAVVRDWCSNVPGFEQDGEAFIQEMISKGVYVVDSSQL